MKNRVSFICGHYFLTPEEYTFSTIPKPLHISDNDEKNNTAKSSQPYCNMGRVILDVAWNTLCVIQDEEIQTTEPWLKETLQNIGDIKSVSSSWSRVAALTTDGKAFIISKDTKRIQRVAFKDKDDDITTETILFSMIKTGDTHVVAVTDDSISGLVNTELEPPVFTPFVPHIKVQQMSCGKEHVLLLSKIGLVYSIGIGSRGQLGHDSVEDAAVPQVVEALEPLRVVSVSAGGWHSAAVSDIGDVYTWGWNETGQLGLPCHSLKTNLPLDNEHGDNVNVQCYPRVLDILSRDGKDVNIVSVVCGARHTAVLTDMGDVYTCGWNKYGQLGHGDTKSRDLLTKINFFNDKVVAIHSGGWTTIVEVDQTKKCVAEKRDEVT